LTIDFRVRNVNGIMERCAEMDAKPIDVTAVTQPGVYVLWYEARCVYIGRSDLPLMQLKAHRTHAGNYIRQYKRPDYVRGVAYDRAEIYPASGVAAVRLAEELVARLHPFHHDLPKPISIPGTFVLKPYPSSPPSPP
jgi:hypothetical protein